MTKRRTKAVLALLRKSLDWLLPPGKPNRLVKDWNYEVETNHGQVCRACILGAPTAIRGRLDHLTAEARGELAAAVSYLYAPGYFRFSKPHTPRQVRSIYNRAIWRLEKQLA